MTDIDECAADTNPCDENAICTNNNGSYSCTCKQGFTGDNTTCEGKEHDLLTSFKLNFLLSFPISGDGASCEGSCF